MKYRYANLERRPAAPARGRGRLQIQVRRAFLVSPTATVSASEIYTWAYPRRRLLERHKPLSQRLRWSVRRVLLQMGAVPVARSPKRGRPIIWRLPR
jgi:hypothetical protein